MSDTGVPHFKNDAGVESVRIGARRFMCIGAAPPFDHPHVFLDMGDENEKICPYCSTLYRYDATLGHAQADPAACVWHEPAHA
ncbi:zinc-finger domain-containing protein [Pseudoxanthobacter sp.]|uniref:zinc-finger domain-containing protein n=1 Tax=Pseudoxanthobacter sp. TaxID=1925742 RepID=UPI002FE05E1C